MATVTEQKLVAPMVQGGNQIQVHDLKLSNYNHMTFLAAANDLIKGLLESDSANSKAQFTPNDQEMVDFGWRQVKQEIELAYEFADSSKGRHEREHWLTVPIDNEVAACGNIQVRRLCQSLLNFVYVGLGTDNSTMQYWSGPKARRDIEKAVKNVDRVIEIYVGAPGTPGLEMPEYPTGTLAPSANLGAVNLREPSTLSPDAGVMDSPDLPSVAPAPGDRQPSR